MEKQKVNLVITDLDDTIWDWVKMWYNSFSPYLENLGKISNIKLEDLKKDFKELHRKYGTTECSYAYHELNNLNKNEKKKITKKNIIGEKSIIHQYYSDKKRNLELYEGVLETLLQLKEKGVLLVGFTESKSFYTKYRIKHLLLDGIFDAIYTPEDHDLPQHVKKYYDEDYWEPKETRIEYLPEETKKPNAKILRKIISDFDTEKKKTIYIGDKLGKDIFMAQNAHVTSVWARYGHRIDSQAYQLLKDVTHWADADVQREIEIKKSFDEKKIQPDLILNEFKDLLKYYDFVEFEPKNPENIKTVVEIWKKIVDAQQHFNDIELRIRNFALTGFTFIIAGIGFCLKEKIYFGGLPLTLFIGLAGIMLLSAFYLMDKLWYHRLLHGAVDHGRFLEQKWRFKLPELSLADSIKRRSPSKIFGKEIHSDGKLNCFYLIIIGMLFVSMWLGFFVKPKTDDTLDKMRANLFSSPIILSTVDSINSCPNSNGVIAMFNQRGKIVYTKATTNIKAELKGLLNGEKKEIFITPLQSKNLPLKKIKILIRDYFEKNLYFKYLVTSIGRKELEEFIIITDNPKFND